MRKKLIDGRMAVLLASQLVVVLIVFFMIVSIGKKGDYEAYRHAGNKLEAAGVLSSAAIEYEKYLESEEIDNITRSKVAFNLARIYEELGNNEAALGWYYKINIFDPGSDNKDESTRRIVAILERMKKYSAAKYELDQGTKLEVDESKKGGVIVAKVEAKSIYLHQLEEELDALPKEIRERFKGVKGKQQYLQKFIADELFLIKAKRAQYDKDPSVRKSVAQLERQILIQKVIEVELKDKLKMDEVDLKNYFKANVEKYKSGKKKVVFKDVRKRVEFDYKMEKTQAAYQKLIAKIVKTEKVEVFLDKVK